MRQIETWAKACRLLIVGMAVLSSTAALAARVTSVSPQGDVAEVAQISVRFDQAVVAMGDPRGAAPYSLACVGTSGVAANPRPAKPAGDARWLNDKQWVFDLREPLAAGVRCTLTRDSGFVALGGAAWAGPDEVRFATGAPRVLAVQPYPGSAIEEDQHFWLRTSGAVDLASVASKVWCEVQGLGERIPVQVVGGVAREQLLRQRDRGIKPERLLLLACQRPFPASAGVRLVWGAGVAAAGVPGLVSLAPVSFEWKVRERFAAEFTCERENAGAPCLPLRPLRLRFNAPVPRAAALAARLQGAGGEPMAPKVARDNRDATLSEIEFAAPLPENSRFTLTLPAALVDETGRALSNAGSFPLTVATGPMPALAKFSGGAFGILEAGSADAPALLPFTLRHVQADLTGAATGGQIRVKTLPINTPDATLLAWLARLQRYHESELTARQAGLPASQWTVVEKRLDERGRSIDVKVPRRIATRELSLLTQDSEARRSELPQLPNTTPRATEVVGLPLPSPGLHVVEIESRILGQALLASRAPMFVRTGALVTNLGVHFKRGRTSSLVWVTTLDRGRPVAGARVAVNDCRGLLLWSGSTDAAGIANIPRGFDEEFGSDNDEPEEGPGAATQKKRCLTDNGFFVSARTGGGTGGGTGGSTGAGAGTGRGTGPATGTNDQLGFVFSRWQRGIEPWRFNIPTGSGTTLERQAHTVFDRTLLRAGETLSMKHFMRDDSAAGLALPAAQTLPTELVITHSATGAETVLPLAWGAKARSALNQWTTPKTAALGLYDVALKQGTQRWLSGSFRVEAFRVPLVDARLSGPSGEVVAPTELAFSAQLNALAGGPMAAAPVKLSALLRPATPNFVGYEDFSFRVQTNDDNSPNNDDNSDGDSSVQLIADRVAATTDKAGAARFSVKPVPALTGASDVNAELSFNDPNGEVQTVSQRLRLWPAAVVVGLRAPGWAMSREPGGQTTFTAVVLDTQGQPLRGRSVSVSARVHQTFSTRKRIVGGFYAYDNRRETRELGAVCSGSTDAQGRLACNVKLAASGEVELLATANDDSGRAAKASVSVWVSSGGEMWFAQDNDDRIDVLPEKREVQPGQTARLQVRMPYRQATALVTVERDGVIDARVLTLSGREPVIELPIPARGEKGTTSWAPNVTVSVLVLRGRLREAPWWSAFTWGWREPAQWWQAFRHEGRDWKAPTALVDLAKPSFKLGVAQLTVGLAEHRLNVSVKADKVQYGVRETARTTVRVTTANGKPAAGAEVAFAAVDEGLLALQVNSSWDILGAFMQPRPWGVETATAQGEIIGRRHYGRKALPPGGGGGRNPTRELFDTLLLWRGSVVLDANGQAVIDVPLNDSLTSFRLVAIADAGADRFGTGSTSVRVSQDLQMLSGLPPLARAGDRFEASFTLRNTTPRVMTLKATLTGQSDTVAGLAVALAANPPQSLTLAAGASQEVRWPVTVPDGTTRIEWLAEVAETGGNAPARDRVKLVQSVVPAVPVRVWQSTLLALDGQVNVPVAPPLDALPGAGGIRVALQARLSGDLPGLRRYFETYPYTCLEQKASRSIALRDQAAWAALAAELPGHIDTDGLASYFPAQPGDAARGSDRLTAYLISAAHEAGWVWPEATQGLLLRGLTAFVEGRTNRDNERRFIAPRPDLDMRKLSALEALSRYGRATPRMLGSVVFTVEAMGNWPTSALLDAWALLRRVDGIPERAARLADVQRLLRARLIEGGSTLKFTTEAQDEWWWLMESADGNAARLLSAAIDQPGWKDDVPRLLTGSLARQNAGAWRTTTANLWGVLALEKFSANFESVAVAGRSTLALGGSSRTPPLSGGSSRTPSLGGSSLIQDWAAAPGGTTLSLPWPPEVTGANAAVKPAAALNLNATHDGPGRPWLTVQSLAAVPLKAPLVAGYRITRSVSAVQRKDPKAWSRGDVLRVRLEVEATGPMAWVVVSDPVPTGAAVLGTGLGRDSAIATRGEQAEGAAWVAFEERGAEHWRSYFAWLPRGKQVMEYTLRLNTVGRFKLPPTRVEAMYAPETFGEIPNGELEVMP